MFLPYAFCTGERIWHCAIPLILAGVALLLLALAMKLNLLGLAFPALLFSTIVFAPDSIMASWTATFLQSTAAATGSATINSVGSLGALVGPPLIGYLEDRFHSFVLAVCILAAMTFVEAGLAACFPRGGSSTPPKDEEHSKFLDAMDNSDAEAPRLDDLDAGQSTT